MQLSSSSSLNAKLYKAFCKNRFSVTLEANDIFNKSNRDIRFYNKDVTLWQSSTSDSRSLLCKRLRIYTLPFIVKVLTFAP